MIAFIGSVFSPYYALARRRGRGDPLHHCALNVALYGQGGKRWAMTERGADAVARERNWLRIGRSALNWDGSGLTVAIDEVGTPLPFRIRGTVRLSPSAVEPRVLTLDDAGRHRWRPIAPCARVEVRLDRPALSWSGPAYFDTNDGDRALECDFQRWDWGRAAQPDGSTIVYDVVRRARPLPVGASAVPADGTHGGLAASSAVERGGSRHVLAMRYAASGGVVDVTPPPATSLSRTGWGITRCIASDAGADPRVAASLEDTPFYARSVVNTQWHGSAVTVLHETLSLERFGALWVQALLPFRMPRALRVIRPR